MANKLTAVFFCSLFLLSTAGCLAGQSAAHQVCFKEHCFKSEVMVTPAQHAQGLMLRNSLPAGQGMLFVFAAEGEYPFWMKNMKFPIDMLWLDADKRIVHIKSNVPPCTGEPCSVYEPHAQALYVLELSAGAARKAGMNTGDVLKF